MLSNTEFIRQSLELHLFFARIMKEHAFFLEIAFMPKDSNLKLQADAFQRQFDQLLAETIALSNCVVSPEVLSTGEVITPYTLRAEIVSSYFTGVNIQTDLTQIEQGLMGSTIPMYNPSFEQRVMILNNNVISMVTALIQFKERVLAEVLSCKIATTNYPTLIQHIIHEAQMYLSITKKLQNRERVNLQEEAYDQEEFWNHIMEEHAKFIRGLLDPSEEELIEMANEFANKFSALTKEAKEEGMPIENITNKSIKATIEIRDFKRQGTQGILDCNIQSIIIPLLADHVLREANHYLRLLEVFNTDLCY